MCASPQVFRVAYWYHSRHGRNWRRARRWAGLVLMSNVVIVGAGLAGLVNNVAVMSDVTPRYAPPGLALVSVSILHEPAGDEEAIARQVQTELGSWFGAQVRQWRWLRTYRPQIRRPGDGDDGRVPGSGTGTTSGTTVDWSEPRTITLPRKSLWHTSYHRAEGWPSG